MKWVIGGGGVVVVRAARLLGIEIPLTVGTGESPVKADHHKIVMSSGKTGHMAKHASVME